MREWGCGAVAVWGSGEWGRGGEGEGSGWSGVWGSRGVREWLAAKTALFLLFSIV